MGSMTPYIRLHLTFLLQLLLVLYFMMCFGEGKFCVKYYTDPEAPIREPCGYCGVCISEMVSYTCEHVCVSGLLTELFTNTTNKCTFKDYCSEQFDKCRPLGYKCLSMFGNYKCDCPKTLFGQKCDHKIGDYNDKPLATIRNIIYTPQFYLSEYSTIIIFLSHIGKDLQIEVDNGRELLIYNEKACKYTINAKDYCSSWFKTDHIPPKFCEGTSYDCNILIKTKFPLSNSTHGDLILNSVGCSYKALSWVGKREHISVKIFSMKQLVFEHNFMMINVNILAYKFICPPIIEITGCANSMKNAPIYPVNQIIYFRSSVRFVFSSICNFIMRYSWKLWKLQYNHNEIYDVPRYIVGDLPLYHMDRFVLEPGIYKQKLIVTLETPPHQFILKDIFYCYFKVVHIPWRPFIVGGIVRYVYHRNDIIFDASKSYNPNLNMEDQSHRWFVWTCNDTEHFCFTFNTSQPIRIIPAPFTEGKAYNFTLIFYSSHNVKPKMTSQIVVIKQAHVPHLLIQCLANCGYGQSKSKTNPAEILYLKVSYVETMEKVVRNNAFIWSYSLRSAHLSLPVDHIRQNGTPSHILIVNKNSLKDGEWYSFNVTGGADIPGSATMQFETCQTPQKGNCSVSPKSGVRGETEFSINCGGFKDYNDVLSLRYEFYDMYPGDNSTGRFLGSVHVESIHHLILIRGKVVIQVYDTCGMFTTLEINVNLTSEASTTGTIKKLLIRLQDIDRHGTQQWQEMMMSVSVLSDAIKNSTEQSLLTKYLIRMIAKGKIENLQDAKMVLSIITNLIDNININDTDNGLGCPSPDNIGTILNIVSNIFIYDVREKINFQMTTNEIDEMSLMFVKSSNAIVSTRDATLSNKSIEVIDHDKYECFKRGSSYMVNSLNNLLYGHALRMLPYQREYTLHTDDISIWVKQDSPFNIRNTITESTNHSIKISAKLLEYLNELSNFIVCEVLMFKQNPFWWSRGGDTNTKTVSLKLGYMSDKLKPIKELTHPVQIFLKNYDYKIINISGTVIQPDIKLSSDTSDFVVAVHQIHPHKGAKIFVKFIGLNQTDIFKVLVLCNMRPDYDFMSSKAINITKDSPTYDITYNYTDNNPVYYIGILPGQGVPAGTLVNYFFELHSARCQVWKHIWSTHGCVVGNETTPDILHCDCHHLSVFGGLLDIPLNRFKQFSDFSLVLTISDNPFVLLFVLSVVILYGLLLFFARKQDKNDKEMRNVVLLKDNFPQDGHPYLLTIYTGARLGAGTTSNVGIQIYGTMSSSRRHVLHCSYRRVLKRGCDDWFLLFTPVYLGEITLLHLWKDCSGSSPNWYCSKILVYDLKTRNEYVFLIESWLGASYRYEFLEAITRPATLVEIGRRAKLSFSDMVLGFREAHTWFSVLARHPRSVISRTQRLSMAMCTIMLTMVTSIGFYTILQDHPEDTPYFSLSMREIMIGIYALLITTCLTHLVHLSFHRGHVYNKTDGDLESHDGEFINFKGNDQTDPDQKPKHKGNFKSNFRRLVLKFIKKRRLIPVQVTAMKHFPVGIKMHWLMFAWLFCSLIIALSAFFTILFGLKIGKVKSLLWLTSTVVSIIQGSIFASPIKIVALCIVFTIVAVKLFDVACYNIKIETILPNPERVDAKMFVSLLEMRSHESYRPLNERQIHLIREMHAVKRKLWLFIDFLVLLLFIIVLFIKIKGMNYHNFYVVNNHVTNLVTTVAESETIHGKIKTIPTFLDHLEMGVFPILYTTKWYNDRPLTEHGEEFPATGWMLDAAHRLIGKPRLRQLRVKPYSCTMAITFINRTGQCQSKFSSRTEDKFSYTTEWKTHGWDDDDFRLFPWQYRTATESSSFSMYGSSGVLYPGGGYVAALKRTRAISEVAITNLRDTYWLDALTRALFFELTIYNVNTKIFSHLTFVMEYIPVGYFTWRIKTDSLEISTTIGIVDILFLGYLSFFALRVLLVMNRLGFKRFLTSVWDIYDTMLVILGACCFIAHIRYITVGSSYIEEFHHSGIDQQFMFQGLFSYTTIIQVLFITLFICTVIRFLRMWRFGPSYEVYYLVLLDSWNMILSITLLLLFWLFLQWGLIVYHINFSLLSYFELLLTFSKGVLHDIVNYSPLSGMKWLMFLIGRFIFIPCFVSYYKTHQRKRLQTLNYCTFLYESIQAKWTNKNKNIK